MKKRIFALALALCMMLSVMPTSFAGNGFLTLDNGEQAPSAPSGILTDDSKAAPQSGVLTVDGAQPSVEEVPEQPAEETPVYGVLTPDQPEEKAPVVQQPVQPAPGVLSMVCDVCGYYDGYHAADCATQQPEDESPEVEETPAQEQTEPVVTIPQEPVVTNYTVETVSTTRTARTLNVARNAAIYNSLRLANNEDEGENAADETDQRVDNDGVVTDKKVIYDAHGNIDHLRLEAYVTGTTTTTTETTAVPVDIVLVLDQSGSMAYKFDGTVDRNLWGLDVTAETDRRQWAMKQAVNSFINEMANQYDATDADHRMALVTFGNSASTLQTWTFVNSAGQETLQGKINGLRVSPSGGTQTGKGMDQAQALLTGNEYRYDGENTTRQKVVILFTGGVPGQSGFDTSVATNAISTAKALKDTGVQVYSIGIFDGADPNQTYGSVYPTESGWVDCDGTIGSKWTGTKVQLWGLGDVSEQDVPAGNRFLNYLSSNYLATTEIGITSWNYTLWEIGYYGWEITNTFNRKSSNYYFTAKDAAGLNSIFQTISETIQSGSASVELDSTTTVTDVISPYFQIPEGVKASDIKVYTADYKADGTWDEAVLSSLTPTIDGNTVTVTGFDFSANYCDNTDGRDETDPTKDGTFYGRKLIIIIPIEVADGFLGGKDIPTNTTGSEIKNGDTVFEEFVPPTVNIDIDPGKVNLDWTTDVAVSSQTVYLSNTADLRNMLSIPSGSLFDGVNNKFVTVTFEIGSAVYTIAPGATSGTWSGECIVDLDECTDYEIVCKIDGLTVTTGEGEAVTANTTTATVHVVKPVATFGEMNIYLSQTPDTTDLVAEDIDWVSTKGDGCTKPVSGEPNISYSYANDKADYKADTTLTATIHLDGTGNDRSVEQDDKVDVNVYLPNVKFVDTTIYLSNTANYADNFDSVVWKHGDTLANDEEMGAAPVLTYESFGYDKAAAAFTGCEDVTVNAVYIDDVNYKVQTVFVEGDKFTVHVLKPSFEITAPDIWADYKQSVDVDGYVTTEVTGWNDATNGHITIPAADESKKPDEEHAFSYTYTAKHGETVVETRNVGTTDEVFTVELAGFNIGTFEGNTNWYVSPEAKTFTVYVNKFDLTINKTWDDVEDCYKQDVIFTVTGDYGTGENQSIQVVIPVGKTSVKVVGLLCGQSYSVAESNPEGINWAWRFTNTQKPNVTCNVRHDVISTTEHARHTVTADFTNRNPATKWFDAIASKFNIFGKGDN